MFIGKEHAERRSVENSSRGAGVRRRRGVFTVRTGKTREKVRDSFTEEEADIFRRARNAKKGTKAKSASVAEYNRSTGIEAVIGYLYLTENHARVREILEKIDVSVQDGRVERKEFKP